MIKQVVIYPNDILSVVASDVDSSDYGSAVNLLPIMYDTMYASNGIGLAAPQIAISKRIVVIDVTESKQSPIGMINPVIVARSNSFIEFYEGCLSVPGVNADVLRHAEISVQYLDQSLKKCTIQASGILSVCLQHEIDHLDGKLFIDRISSEIRDELMANYTTETRNIGE